MLVGCRENVWRSFLWGNDRFSSKIRAQGRSAWRMELNFHKFGHLKDLRMKQFDHILQSLEANAVIFQQLLGSAPAEMIHWRPAPGKWNLLEIACHLRDEDNFDFGARVKHTLENPQVAPPKIDPEAWVNERNYAGQDYGAVMQSFGDARRAWIAYLRGLEAPNWENAWHHPVRGPLPAKLFFENWLAHDYLHIRQIVALKYAYLQAIADVPMDYAGAW
jgi:DinB superfamily